MGSTIIPIILTAIIGGIGWLLKDEKERRREIEKQLSEKKYNVYIRIIELFFSVVNGVRMKKDLPTDDLVNTLMKIMEELLVYGSDSVVKKFSYWKRHAGENDGIGAIVVFAEIILEIRKDMGQPESKVDIDDLLGMFITDYETLKPQLIEYRSRKSPTL